MAEQSFDVVVIGSGPGGYVAAIRAAQLGKKTAVIERDALGGICLNWGCIPTKALLQSAHVYHQLQRLQEYGLSAQKPAFSLEKIVERSRSISAKLSGGIRYLLKKNKVELIEGEGKLIGKNEIEIGKKKVKAKHIILATGARARSFPGIEPDGKHIWSYKEALLPDSLPKKLLVVGSGAIGVEFASFFNALGTKVTIIELLDRIVPAEDEEISNIAKKEFEKQGVKIFTSTKVSNIKTTASGVTAEISSKEGKLSKESFDRAIIAVGVLGNIENLGLDKVGIKTENNQICVNALCQTNTPNIYAIGDVAGAPWLAHKASHEGVLVAEHIAGKSPHTLCRTHIPGCTYSFPQIASIGMNELEAKEKLGAKGIKVGRAPFQGNGKALALGESEGLIKTIFDAKTGELLGAHMIGPEVTELIQGFVVARALEATEEALMGTIWPHPTLSEAMHESVLEAFDQPINL